MEKAGQALRRSGVRLKNISSGHGDLNLILSGLTEMRAASKTVISAQVTLWKDLSNWSYKERNSIIQESLTQFFELNSLWAEVQRQFVANLKKFKHIFKVILEGEQHIDKSVSHLALCEQKESKIRKEIQKTSSKGTTQDIRALEEKLNEAKEHIKAAQMEVNNKVTEQEAVKMIMLKQGFMNLSEYYLSLAGKSLIIFNAQKGIVEGIPDVKDKEIHDIKYTGSEAAKRIVLNAKEQVLLYKTQATPSDPTAPLSPPPYSNSFSPPTYPSVSAVYPPSGQDFSPPSLAYPAVPPSYQSTQNRVLYRNEVSSVTDSTQNVPSSGPIGFESTYSPARYDLPPRELYENIDVVADDRP